MTTMLRTRAWLIAICALAFALRLVATVAFEGLSTGTNPSAFYDGVEFNVLAKSLVERGEYAVTPGTPTSFRAPGFPFLLAAVYTVAGVEHYAVARLIFCLIGALLPLVVFGLARDVADEATALVAAFFVAIYPNLLYYAIHFASEPLYTLLLVGAVWMLLRGIERGTLRYLAASAVLLGFAALTRPIALFFTPFVALLVLWRLRRPLPRRLIAAVSYVACVAAVVAPWMARNARVHGRVVAIASNGGSTFWGSNNDIVLDVPKHRGLWVSTNEFPDLKAHVRALPNEADQDRLEYALGAAWLRDHWRDVPRLIVYKAYRFWTPVSNTPNALFNLILGLSYGPLLPLMVLGIWLSARAWGVRDSRLAVLLLPVALTFFYSLVFHGAARFRSTVEPFLLIFAAAALVHLWRRVRPGASRPSLRPALSAR